MSYWEGIIACGLDGVQMLAMSDLLTDVPEVERAAEVVAETFGEVFGCPIRRLTTA
jgi:lipoate-protein ligase B